MAFGCEFVDEENEQLVEGEDPIGVHPAQEKAEESLADTEETGQEDVQSLVPSNATQRAHGASRCYGFVVPRMSGAAWGIADTRP